MNESIILDWKEMIDGCLRDNLDAIKDGFKVYYNADVKEGLTNVYKSRKERNKLLNYLVDEVSESDVVWESIYRTIDNRLEQYIETKYKNTQKENK